MMIDIEKTIQEMTLEEKRPCVPGWGIGTRKRWNVLE